MNINYIESQNSVLSSVQKKEVIRNPDITGKMLISWFEEPYKNSLNEIHKNNFRELANMIYKCIIDIDDQIDLNLKNMEKVSKNYRGTIINLSNSYNLSDNFRNKVDHFYTNWMSAEDALKYSLLIKSSKKMHNHYSNKVSFLKLIPLALGELTGNEEKSKLICQAYDYAAIANGYIDDLIDFEEDKKSKKTHLLLGLQYSNDEQAKNTFLKQYIKTAIKFNTLASKMFGNTNAKTWKDYCVYQNAGSTILLSMLTTYDSGYILKSAKKYLKGT